MTAIYLLGVVLAVVLLLWVYKRHCNENISDLDIFEMLGIIFISMFSWAGIAAIIIVLILFKLFTK